MVFLFLPAIGRAQTLANPFQEDPRASAKPTPAQIQKLTQAARISPESLSAHMDLGISLAQSGQWRRALEQFDAAQRISPDDPEAAYNRGLTYFMMATARADRSSIDYYDDLDLAVRAVSSALKLNPYLPRIHENLGRLYHLIGDQASATQQFRMESELNSKSAEAWNNLGTSLTGTENYKEAGDCYERALTIDPKCTSCLINLESAILKQGAMANALKKYEALVRSQPDSALAHLLYGMVLTTSHTQQDLAISELRSALRAVPDLAAAHFYLGEKYRENNDNAAAETEYRAALQMAPGNVEFLTALAATLLQQGKTAEAEVLLRKALTLDPGNPSLHYKLSQALQRSGDIRRASLERAETSRLEKADQDQSRLEMSLMRGIADLRSGNASAAVSELRVALTLNPNLPETNYYLGIALSQTGDSTGSVQAFRHALERRPEDAEYHYNFGIALWMSGQSSLAIEQFRRTISIRADDALAHCALGIALSRSGSSDEGAKEIAQAQHLGACSASTR